MQTEQIIRNLSLEEKVMLLEAKDSWHTNELSRLGIPSISMSDGPNGVRASDADGEQVPTTSIPAESLLAASWDRELEEEIGRMVGEECRQYGVHVLLAPGVNGKRSPLCGRNFEYFSEDPVLSGQLAAAFISGLQSRHVGACVKHFALNEQETKRNTVDIDLDERSFRELYLKGFEIAIKEADPWLVMGSYSLFRGKYQCENSYLLHDILRKEFGYEGLTISDWGAAVNKVESHRNGLDVETGTFGRSAELLNAVKSGAVDEAIIDQHVRRLLKLIEKLDFTEKALPVDWDAHHALAQKAAAESIVLLKNQDAILPLQENASVAVIGKFAKEPRYKGAGSSSMCAYKVDIPLDFLSDCAEVEYAEGYDSENVEESLIAQACKTAEGKDAVIVFAGTTEFQECEGLDRTDMRLPESQLALIRALSKVNPRIVVVNASGAAVELSEIDRLAKAIVHTGLCGEGGGKAISDILFGKVNPSGKLAETFPYCLENTAAFPNFPANEKKTFYHEGLLTGYRYYDTKKIAPLYPFGHGLSYTSYAYSNLRLSSREINNTERLEVRVDVTNRGSVSGREIVQLYVGKWDSAFFRPEKELKAYSKIALEPGETKTVTLTLDEAAFSSFIPHQKRFAVESGTYRILVGASSRDIRLEETVLFRSEDDIRLPLDYSNSLGDYLSDDRYEVVTRRILQMFHIDEGSEIYTIALGVSLIMLPNFLTYFGVSDEQARIFAECIYKNRMDLT